MGEFNGKVFKLTAEEFGTLLSGCSNMSADQLSAEIVSHRKAAT
jgi:hypothetical protein